MSKNNNAPKSPAAEKSMFVHAVPPNFGGIDFSKVNEAFAELNLDVALLNAARGLATKFYHNHEYELAEVAKKLGLLSVLGITAPALADGAVKTHLTVLSAGTVMGIQEDMLRIVGRDFGLSGMYGKSADFTPMIEQLSGGLNSEIESEIAKSIMNAVLAKQDSYSQTSSFKRPGKMVDYDDDDDFVFNTQVDGVNVMSRDALASEFEKGVVITAANGVGVPLPPLGPKENNPKGLSDDTLLTTSSGAMSTTAQALHERLTAKLEGRLKEQGYVEQPLPEHLAAQLPWAEGAGTKDGAPFFHNVTELTKGSVADKTQLYTCARCGTDKKLNSFRTYNVSATYPEHILNAISEIYQWHGSKVCGECRKEMGDAISQTVKALNAAAEAEADPKKSDEYKALSESLAKYHADLAQFEAQQAALKTGIDGIDALPDIVKDDNTAAKREELVNNMQTNSELIEVLHKDIASTEAAMRTMLGEPEPVGPKAPETKPANSNSGKGGKGKNHNTKHPNGQTLTRKQRRDLKKNGGMM